MRTITKQVYTFDELSESAKQKAIEWYRGQSNQDNYWSENTIEDAKTIAEMFGLTIDNVYYSGFYSQGDGASFDGKYTYKEGALKAVKEYAPQDTTLHNIVAGLQDVQKHAAYKLIAQCKQSGHYMHSGYMQVDVINSDDEYKDIGEAEDTVIELLRKYADWVYSQLDKENDYNGLDSTISDNIEANDYEFYADGSKFNG